jgi:ankyrin repeat protein
MSGELYTDSGKGRDHNPLRQDNSEERERYRKRGQRYKRLAIPFLVVAGICFVAAVALPIAIVAMNGGEAGGRGFELLGVVFAIPGVLFLIRSRKYRSLSANEVLENDPRPPVIYLRSFKDDRGAGRPLGILRGSNIKYAWHMILGFYNAPHEFMGWSEEEILAQVLQTVGPMVAIGRPGEKLPQLGAARVYVEDAEWQQKVHEFLDEAALVVLRLGKTEGFWWEVEQSAGRLDPRRLVFLVPLHEVQYEEFRKRAEKYFPKGLPAYSSSPLRSLFGKRVDGKVRGLIYFKPDWTPVFVNLYKVRWPWKYKFRMMRRHYLANIYDWALQPVFEQLGAEWKPPSYNPFMIGFKSLGYVTGSTVGLAILGALLLVPYILVSEALYPSPSTLDNHLIEAARDGDALTVESLLKRGADIDGKNATGNYQSVYPLSEAVEGTHIDVARVILDHGANPNGEHRVLKGTFYEDDETPLMIAAENNDAAMIRLLLSHGADINEGGDRSAMARAVFEDSVDAVQALLQGGASCSYGDLTDMGYDGDASVPDGTLESRREEISRTLKAKCAR